MGIWHKLSIHLGFSENRMGVKNLSGLNRAQILHPPTAMPQIRWYGKASLCSNSPSTYSYTNNSMGPLARRTQMSSILTEKEANPMEPKAKSAKMGSIHFGV